MDEKKLDDLMTELRSTSEQLQKDREAFTAEQRAFEKEKAAFKENPGVQRNEALEGALRDIKSAMLEKRAITLSGAGAVAVVGELFKVFKDRTGITQGARFFQGPNAQTKIPVLSPRPALPAGATEGATSISADSTAALSATVLEPMTFVSILPVSFEAVRYSSFDWNTEIYRIFGDAFGMAMAKNMVAGRGKTTYSEFGGLFTSVPAGNQIACASSGAPTIADLVKLALTMQDKEMAAPTIVISPTLYAGITSASVSGYDVYKNELIMNRTIEGVKVEVTGYAPSVTTANAIVAVGFDKNDYAIGIGSEIIIDPIKKVGDTNTYYQACMGMDGKPIVAANVYGLKAISST